MTNPGGLVSHSYELTGHVTTATITEVHELFSRARADNPHIATADVEQVETAAIEVVGNVLAHADQNRQVPYTFLLTIQRDRLAAELVDTGEPVPDTEDPMMPEMWAEHGRGLALVRALVDEMSYQRVDGHNIWNLVRRLATPDT